MDGMQDFTFRQGLAAGMSPGALRSPRLAAPFHGVRSLVEPIDTAGRCRAYAAKMRADAAFTSVTAARLWRIPLPAWLPDEGVDVLTPHGTARAGGRGVRGTQPRAGSFEVVELDGLRVVGAADVWASLARVLSLADLVAAGDYLVTAPFGSSRAPLATPEALQAASARVRRDRRLASAGASFVRIGPLSRPESLLRMLAVTGGAPEPVCNYRASPLLMFDLAWPEWRLGLDYHGASHRSATQHAKDVRRADLAREIGWESMQAAAPDLFDFPFDLLGRLRARLGSRGAPLRPFESRKVALARR